MKKKPPSRRKLLRATAGLSALAFADSVQASSSNEKESDSSKLDRYHDLPYDLFLSNHSKEDISLTVKLYNKSTDEDIFERTIKLPGVRSNNSSSAKFNINNGIEAGTEYILKGRTKEAYNETDVVFSSDSFPRYFNWGVIFTRNKNIDLLLDTA